MTEVKLEKLTPFKKEILLLKKDILELESKYNFLIKEIENKETKMKNTEKKLQELQKINEGYCILNVGGERFSISLYNLKLKKGTLFFKQIQRKEINIGKEVFYDRDPLYFPYILNFLKSGKLEIDNFSSDQKDDLLAEASFYEIGFIVEKLKATVAEVEFSKYEFSGEFKYNEIVVGTNNVKDLKDKSLQKGIVANTPGTITITLSREVEFEEINIAGYNGNSTAWFVGNGRGANIMTSKDNNQWVNVATIPNEFGHEIIKINLTKSKARYIKFTHTDYIGIGYLDIKDILSKKK